MPWLVSSGYNVLKQEQAQSCGYCCIGMVANLIDDRKDSESSLVATGRQIGGIQSYDRATKDRVGMQRTMLVDAEEELGGALPHWGSGTYSDHLAKVLCEGFRINAKAYDSQGSGAMKGAMRGVSANQYMIALVSWTAGGGHWVVVTQRAKRGLGSASDYTVLDPGDGATTTNRGSTEYTSPNGSKGTFAGAYVLVNGRMASKTTDRVKVF